MPELMFFFIVGDTIDKTRANVIRECADGRRIQDCRPSGTLYQISIELELGEIEAWDKVNATLALKAQELGIKTLDNLYPSKDMANIAKIGAGIRARTLATD